MTRRAARTLWTIGALVALAATLAAALWLDSRRLVRVEVEGLAHARRGEVVELARVEIGQRLYDLAPALVEDRVRRHPWIAHVEATRWPSGLLRLRVEERVPVALAVSDDGEALALLDATGMAMPVAPAARALDLPLVRGARLPVNRARPVESPALRAFLAAIPGLSPDADALVSDVRVGASGEIALTTAPAETGAALDVRLGREDFAARLDRLVGFWHQAVRTRPETRYAVVDLRFAGLVVTREATGDAPFPDSTAPAGLVGPVGVDSTVARREAATRASAPRAAPAPLPTDASEPLPRPSRLPVPDA